MIYEISQMNGIFFSLATLGLCETAALADYDFEISFFHFVIVDHHFYRCNG